MCIIKLFKREPICEHEWIEKNRYSANVYDKYISTTRPAEVKLTIELQCKKCGEVKFVKTKL